MIKSKTNQLEIDNFILRHIQSHPKEIVKLTSSELNVSRQTVYRHIRQLIEDKKLNVYGEKRNKSYVLDAINHKVTFALNADKLDEDKIWRQHVKPLLPELSGNVMEICQYGVGEMVNNVIDHSGASILEIKIRIDAINIEVEVTDNGIGIFTKIQQDFNLEDKHHAILELAKGRLTSDPANHSGEGIFFTSRMFDLFAIYSEDTQFIAQDDNDWLFPDRKSFLQGTQVVMIIARDSTRTIKDVFARFTPDIDSENYGFQKTIVPLKMMQYEGESLVSRSQAKRLLGRFEQFREVILDFKGIKIIGQPFADEVFRVFPNAHPTTHLYPLNTNEDIERMIKMVKTEK